MRPIHLVRALLDRAAGLAFAAYGAWSWLGGPRPRLPLRADDLRRVLVVRLDLLGDAVFSVPAIEALAEAFPRARVDVLALPYAEPVVRRLEAVGRVYALDVNRLRRPSGWRELGRLLRLVWLLRRQRYDLAVGLSRLMGGVFAVLSGARWRIGYRAETYWGCYNLPVAGRRYDRGQHEVDHCLDLVRALGVSVVDRRPHLLGGRARNGRGPGPSPLPARRPYAVLVPGASNGSAKRWPPVYWSALGDRLASERGLEVVIAGSAAERPLAERVAAAMVGSADNRAAGTSIDELATLLGGAEIVIAGDTGPLHLAAALGVPVIGIYGPTDPANTGPLADRATVLRLGLACSPCYDLRSPADCKLPDRSAACMWGVGPDRVFEAVSELLDSGQQSAVSDRRAPI